MRPSGPKGSAVWRHHQQAVVGSVSGVPGSGRLRYIAFVRSQTQRVAARRGSCRRSPSATLPRGHQGALHGDLHEVDLVGACPGSGVAPRGRGVARGGAPGPRRTACRPSTFSAASERIGVGATEPSQIARALDRRSPPSKRHGAGDERPVERGALAHLVRTRSAAAVGRGELDRDDHLVGSERRVGGLPALRRLVELGERDRALALRRRARRPSPPEAPITGARLEGCADAQRPLPKMPAVSCTAPAARTGHVSRRRASSTGTT